MSRPLWFWEDRSLEDWYRLGIWPSEDYDQLLDAGRKLDLATVTLRGACNALGHLISALQ